MVKHQLKCFHKMLNSLERFRIFLMALVAFFYGPYFLLHIEFMKNELTKCARYAHALEVMGKNCE